MSSNVDKIEQMTRHAVTEVFRSMLSMDLVEQPPVLESNDPGGQIVASVGFIGEANGIVYLYAGVPFAAVLTSRMLGIPQAEVDDVMVNDAMGELGNMVGGYVKSRLCDGGWPCVLTIPSIVRGQQLSIEGVADVARRIFGYGNNGQHLVVELLIKEPAE
jgi:chemotaxis protein CheX